MGKTKIEWSDMSWPVVTGCSHAGSPGCDMCYAARMAATWLKQHPRYEGLATIENGKAKWTGKVSLNHDVLEQPLHWQKPRMVFVASMGDLFHPDVPFMFVSSVWRIMASHQRHTFQILTKRPKRMLEFLNTHWRGWVYTPKVAPVGYCNKITLPNVWLGTSVENQAAADERIPWLLQIPAAVRFVSCEPLLSVVQLGKWLKSHKAEVQNERERNGVSESTCDRRVLSGQRGSNLALPQIDSREPARFCANGEDIEYPNTRGAECIKWLPQGDVYSEQQAVFDLRTSNRLDGCEPIGHSARVGDQPQERGAPRQQAREPGTSDTAGECTTCRSSSQVIGETRSKRREKLNLKTNGPTGSRDSEVMERRGGQSNNNRKGIRNLPSDGKQYCLPQNLETPSINWVICGGESGPGARPMHPDWARSLKDQCKAASTPYFFKQWGEWLPLSQRTDQRRVTRARETKVHLVPSGEAAQYEYCYRVGRKRAGHLLDGRTWQEFPVSAKVIT